MSLPEFRIEPLRPSHDRTGFQCGVPELDAYFHQQAGQDLKRKIAAPFVLCGDDGAVTGYYMLSAYSVRPQDLPESVRKRLPRYPRIPVTLLGRLAVSREHRGRNFGRLLLMDALYRSWRNTAEVASIGVIVDALDDAARQFYLHHEFVPLADNSNRLFIAMATIDQLVRPR